MRYQCAHVKSVKIEKCDDDDCDGSISMSETRFTRDKCSACEERDRKNAKALKRRSRGPVYDFDCERIPSTPYDNDSGLLLDDD